MNRGEFIDWVEIVGVVAVVASLVFVALEIRTNTESNRIAIEQNYASNWLSINIELAGNSRLAEIVDKGLTGERLTRVEEQQFVSFVRMHLTQSFHMLRLFDQGLISEEEVKGAFRAIRGLAQNEHFRREVEKVTDERRKSIILEPDGLERWLQRH